MEFLTPVTRSLGDIVHFFGTYEGTWEVAKECLRRRVPYVCSPVFLPDEAGIALKLKAQRKRWTDQTSYRGNRRLFQRARRLIVLTAKEQQNLTDYFGKLPSATTIPNGVELAWPDADPDRFRQEFQIESPFVLCVGRVCKRKNQAVILEAMAGSTVPVVLVGPHDGDYVDACRRFAKPVDRIVGSIAHDDPLLGSAYLACHVFCLPSRSEVLSLAALEAAACGAHVVLSNTWGGEEHFGSSAFFVDPNSAALKQAIMAAMALPRRSTEEAAEFAARFTWGSVAEAVENVYREVLSAG